MPSGIPSPMNERLINALFSVSSRIREIRNEMDKLAEEGSDTEDLHGFKSPDPLIHSHEDEEDPGTPPPLSVLVTRSGKRRVMVL